MLKLTPFVLLFILLTITFTVLGQIALKKGMLEIGSSPSHISFLPRFVWKTFTNPLVLLGIASGAGAAVSWAITLSRTDLSVAYPFMSLATVLVLALSSIIFGEALSLNRWVGVLIVCVGIIVAARG